MPTIGPATSIARSWPHRALIRQGQAVDLLGPCARCQTRDLVARYGGEEFAVLLRNTDQTDARVVARQLCYAVANAALPHGGRDDGIDVVTVSVGASSTTNLGEGPAAVLQAADDALYRSKRQSRNCVSSSIIEATATLKISVAERRTAAEPSQGSVRLIRSWI